MAYSAGHGTEVRLRAQTGAAPRVPPTTEGAMATSRTNEYIMIQHNII